MRIYYPNLQAIEQQTRQLDNAQCIHCKQTHQLVSHGFIYKKQVSAGPVATGKRVFCSNRNRHTGCGRTMQLYQDATVRYLHYAGEHIVAFVFALMTGMSVLQAYGHATGSADPRNAYHWLNRFVAQLSGYRSLLHQPLLRTVPPIAAGRPARYGLLGSTFQWLVQRFGQPVCSRYQQQLQRPFL